MCRDPKVEKKLKERISWNPLLCIVVDTLFSFTLFDKHLNYPLGRPTEVFKGVCKTDMVDEYKKERSSENVVKTDVVDKYKERQSSKGIVPSRKRHRLDEEPEDQAMVGVFLSKSSREIAGRRQACEESAC
eukprot:IDg17409t1